MMRWLFFALLISNGLFWYWHSLNERSAASPALVKNAKESIPLLAEIQSQTAAEPRSLEPITAAAEASAAIPASQPKPSEAPAPKVAAEPLTASVAEPVQSEKSLSGAAAKTVSALPDVSAVPTRASCYRIGPVLEPERAAAVEAQLRAQGWTTVREPQQGGAIIGHIVYWPPLADRAAAMAKMRELRAQGVDNFVIAEGEFANGLSLGLFSTEANAERQAEELRGKGLQARVGPRRREQTAASFRVSLAAGQSLDSLYAIKSMNYKKIPCP